MLYFSFTSCLISIFLIFLSCLCNCSASTKPRVDESDSLTLDSIRYSLVRQEDSIIFSLLERSQYCYNAEAYDPNAFLFDGFGVSLVEHMLKETEKLHAQVSLKFQYMSVAPS